MAFLCTLLRADDGRHNLILPHCTLFVIVGHHHQNCDAHLLVNLWTARTLIISHNRGFPIFHSS